MWHFTDVFYHTDSDRLNMVSADEMKHVGVSALATAFLLTAADSKTAVALIDDVTGNALQRLQTEFNLSKTAIQQGGDKQLEKHILEVWANWYIKALAAATDIAVTGADVTVTKAIEASQQRIRQQLAVYIAQL